jgi:hypothetical protein
LRDPTEEWLGFMKIQVLDPMFDAVLVPQLALAKRNSYVSSDKIKLTLIENGKPNAKKLLSMIGEGVKLKFPEIDIFIFSKPSAAKPIDADEAQMLAVRSHMVISGLGD